MKRKMSVRLVGPVPEPELIKVKRGTSIAQEVKSRLDGLSSKTPLLIQAQTGMGKTHAVSSEFIPWAKTKLMEVLYICPRLATIIQAKLAFMRELGEMALAKQRTDEGIRALEQTGNVTVLTAQSLYTRMQTDPDSLKKFGMVIFDEIHLLLDDSLFASSTGYIMNHFRDWFNDAIRIYLSATPEAILPVLIDTEAPHKLQVLKFPKNYEYICPWFFQDMDALVSKINNDKSSARWLVYMPTITKSQQLQQLLTCSVRLLNRVEQEEDPEGYDTILKTEKFDEKVCICTALVDVGVNFKDPLLRNVVIFATDPNKSVQFLGRKRLAANETVNLYVHCPTLQDLNSALVQNAELASAVGLYQQDRPRFLRQHVLCSLDRDLRNWLFVGEEGDLRLNSLVPVYLDMQRKHLEYLTQQAKKTKGIVTSTNL